MPVEIEFAPAPTAEITTLLQELDDALSGPYDDDQQHGLELDALFGPAVRFFVARLDGAAVGCGGVALLDGYAEMKRVYVRTPARGRGISGALLARIEAEARTGGRPFLRLETGCYQDAAIRFYERSGFQRCAAFGPYATLPARAIELSLFFEKAL